MDLWECTSEVLGIWEARFEKQCDRGHRMMSGALGEAPSCQMRSCSDSKLLEMLPADKLCDQYLPTSKKPLLPTQSCGGTSWGR